MKGAYEIGRVYVWHNQVGEFAYLNDMETTILSEYGPVYSATTGQLIGYGQQTDIPDKRGWIFAEPGDLRPKNPPPGEQSIRDLFKQPELETA